MFSALYRRVEPRPEWLRLAKLGRDFLVARAYAGNGRWNYHLDRQGNVKKGTISIYSDMFVLQGLCEYALAAESRSDMALIHETYDTMDRHVRDPDFRDIFHATWSPRFDRHGLYMIGLNTAQTAGAVLGEDGTKSLRDLCLDKILYFFAKDDHQALFESLGRDGGVVDTPEGRLLNPGHTLESMWFCMEEGLRRKDPTIFDRAVQVADWMYQRGLDRQYGGLVSFVDVEGGEPEQTDWHKETNMVWHDKVWWVHSESLYALALAAVETGRADLFDRFLALHEWCRRNFYDAEYGEWYPELYRDGSPKLTDKGTLWKAAYHLPRALMKIMQLFEAGGLPT
jgi:N-acylglucosamine 2-epimerase